MVREIVHDPVFLQQKSMAATAEDLPAAADLMDTLRETDYRFLQRTASGCDDQSGNCQQKRGV